MLGGRGHDVAARTHRRPGRRVQDCPRAAAFPRGRRRQHRPGQRRYDAPRAALSAAPAAPPRRRDTRTITLAEA